MQSKERQKWRPAKAKKKDLTCVFVSCLVLMYYTNVIRFISTLMRVLLNTCNNWLNLGTLLLEAYYTIDLLPKSIWVYSSIAGKPPQDNYPVNEMYFF